MESIITYYNDCFSCDFRVNIIYESPDRPDSMKVLVGMSGGVDSSVAALLLKKQGYEVEGVSLLMFETRLHHKNKKTLNDPRSCCSLESVKDAARTAETIGIPHRLLDARDIFIEKVIEPFALAYSKGRTPNPCILCNRHVKIPVLFEAALKEGADFIATGHYARLQETPEGPLLSRGVDARKDQSYVLYAQRKEELQRLLLPLGGFKKEEVRRMAGTSGLPVFDRPESQEICFIEGRDYPAMIKELCPAALARGPILDETGRKIGAHEGICRYTIGQRKGLGGRRDSHDPKPLYVYRIEAAGNIIYAGGKEKAFASEFEVGGLNWLIDGWDRLESFRAGVKVRSMMPPAQATVFVSGFPDGARVVFESPQWAAAPGQSAVFYDGDAVIGGGIILEKDFSGKGSKKTVTEVQRIKDA